MTHIRAVDAHAHCGTEDLFPPQAFEDYFAAVGDAPIVGAVLFSPVMEIYDRDDPHFTDSPEWQQRRQRSNDYLLTLDPPHFEVFPYFFVWNDFALENLTTRHRGIKWHRHADEPRYHYDDPLCRKAIETIRRRRLPVCFEEELGNTLRFVNELAAEVRVIIPHLGFLNGGYKTLRHLGLWEYPLVYADTSLAAPAEIMDYVERYGFEKIMFGSDFPFGDPPHELGKILKLPITEDMKRAIIEGNIRRLLAGCEKSEFDSSERLGGDSGLSPPVMN